MRAIHHITVITVSHKTRSSLCSDPQPVSSEDQTDENPMFILKRHLVVKRSKLVRFFKNLDLGEEPFVSEEMFREGLRVKNVMFTRSE